MNMICIDSKGDFTLYDLPRKYYAYAFGLLKNVNNGKEMYIVGEQNDILYRVLFDKEKVIEK